MERFIMFRTSWFPWRSLRPRNGRLRQLFSSRAGRGRSPLILEQLEDRTALSNFNAATVSDLIADINAANKAGGSNTITLTAPTTSPYMLTAVDNATDGPTGLPVIANKDALSIIGNGDTIERSTASGTPNFRMFDVASGASLNLNNLTLQNGSELGSSSSAEGGAIYNQGTLVLSAVTVQNNSALGSDGQAGSKHNLSGTAGADAAGGGIWSSGSVTSENGTVIQGNSTGGGNGGSAYQGPYSGYYYSHGGQGIYGGNGGNGFGAGIWSSGSVTSENGTVIQGNLAGGGNGGRAAQLTGAHGGNGGNGFGAGVDIAGGSANLSGTTVSGNSASGGYGGAGVDGFDGCCVAGSGGIGGYAEGGAVYLATSSATLSGDTIENNTVYAGPAGGQSTPVSEGLGGGIYVAGGVATLCNDTIESNSATTAGFGGYGVGGGIYIASGATVYLDSFTVANTINNTDAFGLNSPTANIDGTYTLKNC
jgi:hypothetical protein